MGKAAPGDEASKPDPRPFYVQSASLYTSQSDAHVRISAGTRARGVAEAWLSARLPQIVVPRAGASPKPAAKEPPPSSSRAEARPRARFQGVVATLPRCSPALAALEPSRSSHITSVGKLFFFIPRLVLGRFHQGPDDGSRSSLSTETTPHRKESHLLSLGAAC